MKIFLSLLCVLFSSVAQAQLRASIALKHSEYIQFEKVPLRITLTNTSGLTVNLESEGNWLNIFVEKINGYSLTPGLELKTPPLSLSPNEEVTFEANLTQMYDLSNLGRYEVFLVASPKNFSTPTFSNRLKFTIQQPRTITVQAPANTNDNPKEYRVLEYSRQEFDYLYLQQYSLKKGYPTNTISLGQYMLDYKPTLHIDATGNIFCFYRQNQTFFVQVSLSPEGALQSFEHYTPSRENFNPIQTVDDSGNCVLLHATFYDAEEAARLAKMLKKLSDRPPGF